MNDTPATSLPRTLYVCLSGQRICFSRYELRREPVFAFLDWEIREHTSLAENLREASETTPILQAPTTRVEVIVQSSVTPVPLADFQEEDCTPMYDFCFQTDTDHRVFYDSLAGTDTVLLFSLAEATCRTLEHHFSEVHYTVALTHLLRHFVTKGKTDPAHKRLFVHVRENGIDVAIFVGHRLLTVNTYEAELENDILYYTFNVANSFALNLKDDSFFVVGNSRKREAVAREMNRFARNVFNINPTGEFNRNIVSTTPHVPYELMAALLADKL